MLMPLNSIMNQAMNQTRYMRGAKQLGEVWKPKGTTVFSLPSGGVEKKSPDPCIISSDAMSCAEAGRLAQSGFRLRGFGGEHGVSSTLVQDAEGNAQQNSTQVIKSTDKATVSLTIAYDGAASLDIAYADGREGQSISLDKDTRISWDGGEPVIMQGKEALSGGLLAASGKDEILVRLSGADVVAGEASTVINFSDEGGSFSGGSGVTYQGRYTNCVFDYDNAGAVDFAGYFSTTTVRATGNNQAAFSGMFENSAIESSGTGNSFSGFFIGSSVKALSGDNIFSGFFLEKSSIVAGEGKDRFTGRFENSAIDAGNGNNSFGTGIELNSFNHMSSGFIGTSIIAGSGKDVFFGKSVESLINLGEGDDEVQGASWNSTVNTGNGNDSIALVYSNGDALNAGEGDDLLAVGTGLGSNLNAGSGNDRVVMGYGGGKGSDTSSYALYGVGGAVLDSTWLTGEEASIPNHRPRGFGELSGNTLDASQGDNLIAVHSGEGSHIIRTGDVRQDGEAESPEAALQETADSMQEALFESGDSASAEESAAADEDSAIDPALSGEEQERRMHVSGAPLRDEGIAGVTIDGGTGAVLEVLVKDNFLRDAERAEYVKPEAEPTREQVALGNAVQFGLFGTAREESSAFGGDRSAERRRAMRAYGDSHG